MVAAQFFIFVILTTFVHTIQATSYTSTRCKPVQKLSPEFCRSPPVTSKEVILSSYAGTWYQIATSGSAGRVSASLCSTANYTLRADSSIGVQNCFYPTGAPKPSCLPGVASRRPNGNSAQLQVQFSPSAPAGQYNIAALLGNANYGYYAAAVFSCSIIQGEPSDGFFFIARSPFNAQVTIRKLLLELGCMGYPIPKDIKPTNHGDTCKYFFGPDGFNPITFGQSPRFE